MSQSTVNSLAIQDWTQRCQQEPVSNLPQFVTSCGSLTEQDIVAIIRADQRHRWRHHERALAEVYLSQFTQLDAEHQLDVIYAEVLLRETIGEPFDPAEYGQRFPELVETLKDQLELHSALRVSAEATDNPQTPRSAKAPKIPGYEVLEELGRGGMGVVYRARHLRLRRLVALKVLLSGAHGSPQQLDRFQKEATAVARLQHPHIVQIFEVGEADGFPFLALELVEGQTLSAVTRRQPMSARDAAAIVSQLANAVDYAHRLGIIHRDLKPGNVLLQTMKAASTPADSATKLELAPWNTKITDFGLAKISDQSLAFEIGGSLHGEVPNETCAGEILGTPSYMAPEQASGRSAAVGHRVDIHALGAILYELLTGRPPYQGASAIDILQQVVHDEPVLPSRLVRNLPRDLETICLKCLRKLPEGRYDSALALADDLQRFLTEQPILARRAGIVRRSILAARRNPTVAILTTLMAILLLSTVIAQAFNNARIRHEVTEKTTALQAKGAALQDKEAALARAAESERLARRRFYAAQMNLAQQAVISGDLSRALDFLESLRPATGAEDLRGFEWQFVWNQLHASLYRTLRIGAGEVAAIEFSPDGRSLAVACLGDEHGSLSLWDVATGERLKQLNQQPDSVHGLAFSPDGKFLVSTSQRHAAILWDVATRQEVVRLKAGSIVRSVDWSRDGTWIAIGEQGGAVRLFDAVTRQQTAELTKHHQAVLSLHFSPDGKQLYSSSGFDTADQVTHIHNLQQLPPPPPLEIKQCHVRDVSSDGKSIATFEWGTMQLRDARSGKQRWERTVSKSCLHNMKFAPDGRIARTGFDDRLAELWNEQSDQPLRRVAHSGAILSVAFDSQHKYWATGSGDGEVKIWYDRDPPSPRVWQHEPSASHFALAPRTSTLFLAGNFPAEAHDLRTDSPESVVSMTEVRGLRQVSPDGKVLLSVVPTPLEKRGTDVAINEATTKLPETIEIWDRNSSAPRIRFRLPDEKELAWRSIALYESGRKLVAAQWGGPLRVWDITDREARPLGETTPVNSLYIALSPDEKHLVACCQYGFVRVWNLETMTPLPDLMGHESNSGWSVAACFSHDGRLIATASSAGIIRVWDFPSGKQVASLKGHVGEIQDIKFLPNNRTLVVAGAGPIRLWDVETSQELLAIPTSDFKVIQLAISEDGQTLFSLGDSGVVREWTVKDGSPRQ